MLKINVCARLLLQVLWVNHHQEYYFENIFRSYQLGTSDTKCDIYTGSLSTKQERDRKMPNVPNDSPPFPDRTFLPQFTWTIWTTSLGAARTPAAGNRTRPSWTGSNSWPCACTCAWRSPSTWLSCRWRRWQISRNTRLSSVWLCTTNPVWRIRNRSRANSAGDCFRCYRHHLHRFLYRWLHRKGWSATLQPCGVLLKREKNNKFTIGSIVCTTK